MAWHGMVWHGTPKYRVPIYLGYFEYESTHVPCLPTLLTYIPNPTNDIIYYPLMRGGHTTLRIPV